MAIGKIGVVKPDDLNQRNKSENEEKSSKTQELVLKKEGIII